VRQGNSSFSLLLSKNIKSLTIKIKTMKKLTTLLLTAMSSIMLAQIPNPSFETWSSGDPTGWFTANDILPGYIIQSSNAYAGTSAVKIICQYNAGGFLWTGTEGDIYFVNAGNPGALNGWYILNSVGGDYLEITAGTKAGSSSNGAGTNKLSNSTAVYKQFSVCMNYTSGTADSATIEIQIANSAGTTNASTYAIVDDLSFGTCTPMGVEDINSNVTLEAAYPNPASTTCNIIFSIPSSANVNVSIYDLSGRKILSALENTVLSDGRYKVPVDVTKLANGVYAYTITVDGVPYTQKLVVAK
jgi:hypothetical protein